MRAVDLDPILAPSGAGARRRGRWRGCAAADSWSRRRPRGRPSHCGSRRRVRMSRIVMPRCVQLDERARAARVAISSQTGCPHGASAECGSAMPSASATTCEVAAVPRNWQPPPGRSARAAAEFGGFLQREQAARIARADRLHRARVFAIASAAASRRRARARPADRASPASAIIIAGRPLSQVATPSTPARRGSERMSRRKTIAASLR